MFAPESDSSTTGRAASAGALRVLGIDPGLTRCGYAVLDLEHAGSIRAVSMGVLRTAPSDSLARRLGHLLVDFRDLFQDFSPSAVAIEQVFFQANARTAIGVAQASGLVMALADERTCRVVEYTPNQVKEAVTGWGGADKSQVQKMVRARLGLSRLPEPVDAADAAAVGICFLASDSLERQLMTAGAETVHGRVRGR